MYKFVDKTGAQLPQGIVASVEPKSIAEEAGILPGDAIVSIDGHAVSDIVDYRYYAAEEEVKLVFRRGNQEFIVEIEKDYDDPLGVEFEDELFDGVRTCGNNCIFCFVHQLPRGMRLPLYLKDDDFRLSFMHGNFVTLTNVDESDIARIIEQRLSPLYISVHATEPELRARMLGHAGATIMDQLRALAAGGITLHTQIVVCPSWNDGDHLERTVSDLASLHPSVASIGIVPVGLTKHRRIGHRIHSIDPSAAGQIIRQVQTWQREFREKLDTRLVWASDELYLAADRPIPSSAAYEGFPQIENGIGLVRRFLDDVRRTIRRLPERIPRTAKATIVTSTLAAPLLQEFAEALNRVTNLQVRVEAVRNEFFGESVTVAGLLTGQDVHAQLTGTDLGDVVLVPAVMLRDGAFLDDMTLADLSGRLGRRVVSIDPTPRALANYLLTASPSR